MYKDMRWVKPKLLSRMLTSDNDAKVRFKASIGRGGDYISSKKDYRFELIRKDDGIADVEIVARKRNVSRYPDFLFGVHRYYDGDMWVSARPFRKKKDTLFQNIFKIGNGRACSICFDGRWVRDKERLSLVTEELPWIFYVNSLGILYAQKFDDFNNMIYISSDVLKVKSIRGWKSDLFGDFDLGLIVLYQKSDKKLYYRSYCEQADGSFMFEAERKIDYDGDISEFNLYETNDYRIGISVVDSLGNSFLITSKRYWSGLGIKGDSVKVSSKNEIEFIELDRFSVRFRDSVKVSSKNMLEYLYAGKENGVFFVRNVDDGSGDFGKVLLVGFYHELFNINHLGFSITDSRGIRTSASSVEYVGMGSSRDRFAYVYRVRFNDFNNFKGEILFRFSDGGTNCLGVKYGDFSFSFLPIKLVYNEVPPPVPVSIKNLGDFKIVIRFDKEILSGVEESLSAFSVSSVGRKSTFNSTQVKYVNEVIGIRLSEDRLEIELTVACTPSFSKLNSVSVGYQNGAMFGVNMPIESFNLSFSPDKIVKFVDPESNDSVSVSSKNSVEFIKVDFLNAFGGGDSVRVSSVNTIEFIDISVINP